MKLKNIKPELKALVIILILVISMNVHFYFDDDVTSSQFGKFIIFNLIGIVVVLLLLGTSLGKKNKSK